MRVLVACEFTGIVRSVFRALGHDAWSCDLEESEYEPQFHIMGDVLDVLDMKWDLMVAHPPCTYLCNAGVQLLNTSARWEKMAAAADFFNRLHRADIGRIAIENPIPHRYAKTLIGDYTQLIQPWQFGHGEVKPTCLWLKGLPELKPTELCIGRKSASTNETKKDRSKSRSRTFPGIAVAMAQQWGEA